MSVCLNMYVCRPMNVCMYVCVCVCVCVGGRCVLMLVMLMIPVASSGGTEPCKLHQCIHQTLRNWKNII